MFIYKKLFEKKLPLGHLGHPNDIGKFIKFIVDNKMKNIRVLDTENKNQIKFKKEVKQIILLSLSPSKIRKQLVYKIKNLITKNHQDEVYSL